MCWNTHSPLLWLHEKDAGPFIIWAQYSTVNALTISAPLRTTVSGTPPPQKKRSKDDVRARGQKDRGSGHEHDDCVQVAFVGAHGLLSQEQPLSSH